MQTASSSDRVSVHHVYHCQQLKSLQLQTMGRRPLPAVRDLALDGRWSTYDVSVLKKMGGKMRTDRTPSKATITNKTCPAGSFSSIYPGPVQCSVYTYFLWSHPPYSYIPIGKIPPPPPPQTHISLTTILLPGLCHSNASFSLVACMGLRT